MSALQSLGSLIDAFRPADGPPPQRLVPFMRWSLAGSWPMLVLAGVLSSLAGVTEVVSALILGWVVDAAVSSSPEGFFVTNWTLILWGVVFYLVLRPLAFAVSSASNSIIIGPNVLPLVLSRLHRWTLGSGRHLLRQRLRRSDRAKADAGRPRRHRCRDRGDQHRLLRPGLGHRLGDLPAGR
jgi:ATP-binding cassette, subfamily B, bacterial